MPDADRYMITHSLLYSWLYAMKDSPYSDATNEAADPYADFLTVLRREPTEQTEAMLNGIEFEDLVTDVLAGHADEGHKWYEAARKVADIVGDGRLQFKASKDVKVFDMHIFLYGRLDVLRGGHIYDIKFSKSYERGKYIDSTQHPMYLDLIPEAEDFTYVISDGTNVWTETYRRDETKPIMHTVTAFLEWLNNVGLTQTFRDHWLAK